MLKLHYLIKIPDCPHCDSSHTGLLLSQSLNARQEYLLARRYARRGMIVRTKQLSDGDNNIFCEDCGLCWYEKIEGSFVSKQEFIDYREHKMAGHIEISMPIIPKKQNKLRGKIIGGAKFLGKTFAKRMIYDPTIGTVKDMLGIHPTSKPKSDGKNQNIPQDFNQLYDLFCADNQISDMDSE